jgi:hypothetical protein
MTLLTRGGWMLLVGWLVVSCGGTAPDSQERSVDGYLGAWDVTVQGKDGDYPSWFEVTRGPNGTLQGRFVGRFGSARPIAKLEVVEGELRFSLPVQYESHPTDLSFVGRLEGEALVGTTNAEDGSTISWRAVRAPALERSGEPQWGEPVHLTAGELASLWRARHPDLPNNWVLRDGVLENTAKGTDLITVQEFGDFKLQTEFMYPAGSNGGIYLRGRYEVQIQDDYGKDPSSVFIGGVYGFLTPRVNAGKPAGEWQTYEITLVGRTVTIVLNGETIIDRQVIPGITGGALDANEGEPGPLMLQGDHGPVSFRNLVVVPAL